MAIDEDISMIKFTEKLGIGVDEEVIDIFNRDRNVKKKNKFYFKI